jgi:hypothetical protein
VRHYLTGLDHSDHRSCDHLVSRIVAIRLLVNFGQRRCGREQPDESFYSSGVLPSDRPLTVRERASSADGSSSFCGFGIERKRWDFVFLVEWDGRFSPGAGL